MEYAIVWILDSNAQNSINRLTKVVGERIAAGWKPLGSASMGIGGQGGVCYSSGSARSSKWIRTEGVTMMS